jgi:head-tail adaptor
MPTVDLRSILGPVIDTVAGLVFPDVVSIESPVREQDDTGDPVTTWAPVWTDVPALIAPVSGREASSSGLPITTDDVSILLAGDVAVETSYRIVSEFDRWDVVGVIRDEVRVTTTAYGRRVIPGTPEEGEAGS